VPYVDPVCGPLTLNVYRSPTFTADRPVVLVQHGVMRNGDDYRDYWVEAADRHGLLIVAPTFDESRWPDLASYNDGRVLAHRNRPEAWTYAVLPRLVQALQAEGITTQAKVYLFGHSAGGQFVHRLMSSQSHAEFEAVTAGNAGWYTLPSLAGAPFPEGMADVGLGHTHLVALLAFPMTILVGDRDNDVTDPYLPRQEGAMRQGPHRLARAHHYFECGKQAAASLQVPFKWQLVEVPGVGHDGRTMSAVCASLWFDGRMLPAADIARLVSMDDTSTPIPTLTAPPLPKYVRCVCVCVCVCLLGVWTLQPYICVCICVCVCQGSTVTLNKIYTIVYTLFGLHLKYVGESQTSVGQSVQTHTHTHTHTHTTCDTHLA
jgi:hypothetical protein